MEIFNMMNRGIFYLALLVFILSCEKYSTGEDCRENFNANYRKIYGEWISEKKCGGWTGGCSGYIGETLIIDESCDFEITDNQGKYALGELNIISQDSMNLIVKLDLKQGELRLFSSDALFVSFISNDTIIFHEGGYERWEYEFVRKP